MIISRSPYRITLGGGGTDLPTFYKKHGGFVISMALDKYIYVTLKPDTIEEQIKVRYLKTEIVDKLDSLKHDRAREALRKHGLHKSVEISSCGDVPGNTGLGSSGSYLVALLNVIRYYTKQNFSPTSLAEEAFSIEHNLLGHPVGKQDQYIAAHGGFKCFNFPANPEHNTAVKDVNISASNTLALINNLHIYYLKKKRNASSILKEQNSNNPSNEEKLLKVKEMGYKTIDFLESGNFDDYVLLLDEYWSLKKQFSEKMSFSFADEIYSELKSRFGILGGKIIGAGGGGFLMVYANKNHQEIEKFMRDSGVLRLNYLPDYHGSTILGDFTSTNQRQLSHGNS